MTYTPGSIFKLVTSVAAIDTISDIYQQTFTCTGRQIIGGQEVICSGVHGEINFSEGLAHSCNIVFGNIAEQLGAKTLERYARRLGPVSYTHLDVYKRQVLLETMAGKGTEIGGRFSELRAVIDRCRLPEKLGVCLDTCHVHDAGYDIVSQFEDVLAEFDRVLGLSRLRAIHLNDSKNPLGARKDRHECIGRGELGLEALERVLRFAAARDLPVVLETPNDLAGYAAEITLLRNNF